MAQRWTPDEKLEVFKGVGTLGWTGLQRHAGDSYDDPDLPPGRSKEAVRRQVRRMCDSGARRGAISLRMLSDRTGYHFTQLKRAQKALNQSWPRMSKGGSYLISDDQVRDLLAWLSHDFWCVGKRLYCCCWCTTSNKPHAVGGLCERCFYKYRRKCLVTGLPSAMKTQKEILDQMVLDCANARVHAKFLEEARDRLKKGLVLTEGLLDWLVTVYVGREDKSGNDS